MACPVCGDDRKSAAGTYRRRLARRPWRAALSRCESCGHVYVDPQPTDEQLAPFYRSGYHVFAADFLDAEAAAAAVRATGEGRYNHVRVLEGGRYLDVGCAIGDQLSVLKALGMDVIGVEPSGVATDLARGRGLDVRCGTLGAAALPSDHVDRASLNHVLEHVHAPVDLLAECRRVLRPGGELTVIVPNYDSLVFERTGRWWIGLDLPRHLQQFTPASLGTALERAGFTVASTVTESYLGLTTESVVESEHRRTFLPRRLVRGNPRVAEQARRLNEESLAQGRGDVLICVGVK